MMDLQPKEKNKCDWRKSDENPLNLVVRQAANQLGQQRGANEKKKEGKEIGCRQPKQKANSTREVKWGVQIKERSPMKNCTTKSSSPSTSPQNRAAHMSHLKSHKPAARQLCSGRRSQLLRERSRSSFSFPVAMPKPKFCTSTTTTTHGRFVPSTHHLIHQLSPILALAGKLP